jgi:hypothetical protein
MLAVSSGDESATVRTRLLFLKEDRRLRLDAEEINALAYALQGVHADRRLRVRELGILN